MADRAVTATVMIMAALVQGGHFTLSDDDRAQILALKEDGDWRTIPALLELRRLAEGVTRAATEQLEPPDQSILSQITGVG
ncbi:MAG TPA: hypothetical protein VKH42_09930 [Vicinamibacterales bacterium]|nr:hypothetical protein [Vicinamibacterales bacterium]